ncbi:hypothetical protein F2P81_022184 [Scophthalmus maximus]|uniref:DMAP1-binding domain-containing protein n=1 Tax=Scophthalmus maximus TaxID=52904 RepID=A0A6A4RTF5_SCOMX|nr:hypothetical protein F2P81_022184 [Scophthalmus maximus]
MSSSMELWTVCLSLFINHGFAGKMKIVEEPNTFGYVKQKSLYPTLTEKLQGEWDEAEQARYEGLITEQGYNNLLRDIFEDAGLLKSQKVKVKLPEVAVNSETHISLQKCTEDFEKQSEEIERLRALLTQHNIPFDSKPNETQGIMTVTVKDQHPRGDNGLIDLQ